ncbi:MAG: DUF368 domain-containing protein [Candidatus Hydrogenedentota bacterium]|nr:MAG: DUF368 domain-containing protein [Candidatus Hydrogenedentota bacterium]
MKKLHKKLGLFLRGIAMGAADIIPGVSGGTMALITGIYDRLIDGLGNLKLQHIPLLYQYVFSKGEKKQQAKNEIQKLDWELYFFLPPGILLGIVLMSFLIQVLLQDYTAQTYAFFFGLILISATVPWKLMNHRILEYTILLLFAGIMFFISGISPWKDAHLYRQDANKKMHTLNLSREGKFSLPFKVQNLQEGATLILVMSNHKYYYKIDGKKIITMNPNSPEVFLRQKGNKLTGVIALKSNHSYPVIFLSAAVAICAMILPGISGAYILVLFGQYAFIFQALHSFHIPVLMVFLLGVIAGLFSFVRLLKLLLHRYHSLTMAALTGIMMGSLRKLWPTNYEVIDAQNIYSVIAAGILGIVLVLILEYGSQYFQKRELN